MVLIKSQAGFTEEFSRKKIIESITKDVDFLKTHNGTTEIDLDGIKRVADKVKRLVDKMEMDDEEILSSDTIRGLVVAQLYKIGENSLAGISELAGLRVVELHDIIHGSDDHDNANLKASPETTHKLIADKISKKYYEKILPANLVKAHIKGYIHCHDEEYFGTRPFCRSWDLRPFFYYGFSPEGNVGATIAGPAKHAHVAILQACKVLAMGQTQHSGGQGLLHGTVFLAPYMVGKSYEEIYQLMQLLIYELNQMYISRGGQVIFSSVNINPGVPKILENVKAVRAGEILDATYGDFEREVRLQFKALMEISLQGDYAGSMFPFPKLEVAIEKKFVDPETWDIPIRTYYPDEDEATDIEEFKTWSDNLEITEIGPSYKELYELAFKVVARFGSLYFDNMLPEPRKAESTMGCTQCCSYQFKDSSETNKDFDKALNFIDGYHFRLGGMQVVSINLPRMAYLSDHNDKKLIANIYQSIDDALQLFKIKKDMIIKISDRLKFINQTPETDGVKGQKYVDIDSLVYEIGIVGLNEMCQYHTGYQLHENEASIKLGESILSQMNKYCKLISEFNDIKVVLSRTPGETVVQKFAICDLLDPKFQDQCKSVVKGNLDDAIDLCKSGNKNVPIYYSNGFASSVDADITIFERLKIEDRFWKLVDGGAVTNIWLGEDNPDPDGLMSFAFNIFRNTDIGYLSFTKNMSQCNKCNKIHNGLLYKCSSCYSDELTWYSRVTGYYSVVGRTKDGKLNESWGAHKIEELERRKLVTI